MLWLVEVIVLQCESLATAASTQGEKHRWPSNILEVRTYRCSNPCREHFLQLNERCMVARPLVDQTHSHGPWPFAAILLRHGNACDDVQVMATSSIQMARHANACKWRKRAVVLYRCAAAFWSAIERPSVDDLRYASEAYLIAARIAVELAEQVTYPFHHSIGAASDKHSAYSHNVAQPSTEVQADGKDKETTRVASCMLYKATALLDQLQQSMFFVANEVDRGLAIDRDHCSLQVALLKQDTNAVKLALRKLCEGNSPEALWQAAAILRGGVLHWLYRNACPTSGHPERCYLVLPW